MNYVKNGLKLVQHRFPQIFLKINHNSDCLHIPLLVFQKREHVVLCPAVHRPSVTNNLMSTEERLTETSNDTDYANIEIYGGLSSLIMAPGGY